MSKTFAFIHPNTTAIITLIIAVSTACRSTADGGAEIALLETVSAQSTLLVQLSTQVAQQDQINTSQWEALSYLSTQMPSVLGLITPLPPGITITPTPYSDDGPGLETSFTPTPSPFIDIEYPPDTRTGIDEVDLVIDAFLDQDMDARLDLIRLTISACTTADGLGGPPKCQTGEEEGTLVEAFPVSSGEGTHVRPENISKVFAFTVRGLLAVYRVPADAYQAEYWPAGEYGVVFTSEDGEIPQAIIVLVENDQIVRLEFIPGWPPFDSIWGKSDEFILPPIR